MINAIQPESYLPPHKHLGKTEVFLALKGRLLVVEYDDEGNISDKAIIGINELNKGAEIAPEIWHNIIALEKDSVAYEIIDGPYIAEKHKIFPEWAPKEENYEEGLKFNQRIKNTLLR